MYSKSDLLESRTADTGTPANSTTGLIAQSVSLAKVVSTEPTARAWRVTLARIGRVDNAALNSGVFPNFPLLRFPGYQYTAGLAFASTVPPRRSNPVWGFNTFFADAAEAPGFNAVSELWVQISFGMPGAEPSRILAQWPMQGGSLVVEGSYVEVFGAVRIVNNVNIDPGSFPKFQAMITPVDGLASSDAGELSITQRVDVQNQSAGMAESGIETNGVTDPPGFLLSSVGDVPGALGIGAVGGVPTTGWTAVLVRDNDSVTWPFQVVIANTEDGPAGIELRDNETPVEGSADWIPSPGNVGIRINSNLGAAYQTVAALETAIATSTIVRVSVADPNPAFLINDLWAVDVTYAGEFMGNGIATSAGETQGGQVFVPDFARRVLVTLTRESPEFVSNEQRVPITGPLPCQLVWYDDFGRSIFSEYQGPLAAPNTGTEPTVWRPVPANAVMLGVYGEPDSEPPELVAMIHWRIAT